MLRSTLPALIAAVGLGMPLVAGSPGPAAPVDRTVFVTVTDGKGVPVTDMTPADFVVKEGGKERQVLKAEPATARMKVALAVEERIVGIGAIRLALFEFAKRGQYAVTYTLPDGVKMERRFNITTKKRGVTVRGPSLIPDR